MRFGYYADLRGLTFAEGKSSWITAMRVGEYKHPMYGQISFTMDRLKRFADSVKNKVRGIDLDIDYDHKQDVARGGEAAGWVRDARVEGDTLQLLVEWTSTAASKIKEGAYRYFSPEFQDDWTDAQGQKHVDVLFGGGITNRPFLKDLLPVNLNELTFAEQQKEGKGMDPKELRKALGLPEDATDEQVIATAQSNREAAQNKLGTPPDSTATTHAPNNAATTNANGTINGLPYDATTAGQVDKDGNAITPEDVQLNELAKTNPALAFMLREQMKNNKALTERLAAVESQNKVQAITLKLNEYRTGNTVVAPAVLDEAAKLLAKAPTQLHEEIHSLLKLVQGGKTTVQLGETPGTYNGSGAQPGSKSASDEVDERIAATRKKFSENGGQGELGYADALTQVFAEDPELFARYQNEAYAFRA